MTVKLGTLKEQGERGAVFRVHGKLHMVLSVCAGMNRDLKTPMGGEETTAVVVLEGDKVGCTYFYQDSLEVHVLSTNGILEIPLKDF
jgi:hypothetical protein